MPGIMRNAETANQKMARSRMCPANRLCTGINGTRPAGLPQPGQ